MNRLPHSLHLGPLSVIKEYLRKPALFSCLMVATLIAFNTSLFAQAHVTISGPSTVSMGIPYTYNHTLSETVYVYSWNAYKGTVNSSDNKKAIITFTSSGTGSVTLELDTELNWYRSTKSVTINAPPLPATPSVTFAVSTNNCGPKTISYTQNPPSGVTWYWQTTSTGTSTANATKSYIAATLGTRTYYLRAKNASGWSSGSASKSVTVNDAGPTASTPSISTNLCGTKTLTNTSPIVTNVRYYWQGTNGNGTSTGNSNPTYNVTTSGTYYIRGRNTSTLCWGTSKSVYVTVNNDIPPAPANRDTYITCKGEAITLTTTGIPSWGTLRWYSSVGTFLYEGTHYTAMHNTAGNFTYRVKAKSSTGCESTSYALVTGKVHASCDYRRNWQSTTLYWPGPDNTVDEAGSAITYFDEFGKPLQSQSRAYAHSKILATQTIYDKMGNAAISTLPAPTDRTGFTYKENFVSSASGEYGAEDFDMPVTGANSPGQINNPKPVVNGGPGTLGWYYSSSNTMEPLTPTTQFPYGRGWVEDGPDPKKSESAGPGDQYRMGTGRTGKGEFRKIISGELNHYNSLRTHFGVANTTLNVNLGYRSMSTGPDGKSSVTFTDSDGKTLATALVNATGAYTYWSYIYYNEVGQVVATVAPEGVNTASTALPKFVTLYYYDHLGRMIKSTAPDEGTSEFVYSLDGNIRFSQNQQQKNDTPKNSPIPIMMPWAG